MSITGCKLTILPDIQPVNQIVNISEHHRVYCLMRQKRHYLFDMSYLEDFGVLTGVRVDDSKFFGVEAGAGVLKCGAGAESESEKCDSAHLCPSVKAKSQVSLYASWGNLNFKMQHSTTRQAEQKTCANHDHHWSKNAHFLVCKRTGFVNQELRDFAKITLIRVSSHDCDSSRADTFCEKPDSSRVTRLESSNQVDSRRVGVTKNLDLSRDTDSCQAVNGRK